MGADLKEDSPVAEAKFDNGAGLWTVTIDDSEAEYKARVCTLNIICLTLSVPELHLCLCKQVGSRPAAE